jgi:carboxyl-terminal processing protease
MKLRWSVAVALCLTGFLLLETIPADRSRAYAQDESKSESKIAPEESKDLKTFANALAIVEQNSVPHVSAKKLIDYAIGGMLASLDPHSVYLTGDTLRDRQVDIGGKYGGLGIQIMIRNGVVTIKSVMDGTPAAKAGMKSGDQIVRIDGETVHDMTFAQAKDKMRGPRGSAVDILVRRAGVSEPLSMRLVRDIIEIQSVKTRTLDDGYIYIQLALFQQGSNENIETAIESYREKHDGEIKGLILDLRDNPGGLLSQAVKISDEFLDAQQIVYTQGRSSNPHRYFSHRKRDYYEYPMAVLVNTGTASASEILAGALQDNGRAVIVGTRTFGKGSVQTLIPVDDYSALQLTTALYYTPNGCSIQAVGINPDVVVENPRHSAVDEVTVDSDKAVVIDPHDAQLRKAIDVLEYWDSFKTQITKQAETHTCHVG